MRLDLKIKKFLFKAKIQSANSSSGKGEDRWHNIEADGRMHSRDAEIADMVEEHLQTKQKTRIRERGWAGSKRENRKEEESVSLWPFTFLFGLNTVLVPVV
jgi:hypothetical protein